MQGAKKQKAKKSQAQANAPSALGYQLPTVGFRSAAPTRKGASVRLVGCDYYGSISSSAAAAVDNVIPMRPENSTSFPRLANVAAAFELYAFNKLKVHTIGKAASTQPGTYTTVFNYDANGSTYTAAQVRNEEGQVTEKFWANARTQADCSRAVRPWFSFGIGGVQDTTFADLHVFTEQTTSAVPVVDVFLEYDIEFAQGQAAAAPELQRIMPLLRRRGVASALTEWFRERGFLKEVITEEPEDDELAGAIRSLGLAQLQAKPSVQNGLSAASLTARKGV